MLSERSWNNYGLNARLLHELLPHSRSLQAMTQVAARNQSRNQFPAMLAAISRQMTLVQAERLRRADHERAKSSQLLF